MFDGSKLPLLGELLGASDGALDRAEPPPLLCCWKSFMERLDLSEVTFGGILHWAYTCTALLRAALASLLAAVCEVYAN